MGGLLRFQKTADPELDTDSDITEHTADCEHSANSISDNTAEYTSGIKSVVEYSIQMAFLWWFDGGPKMYADFLTIEVGRR